MLCLVLGLQIVSTVYALSNTGYYTVDENTGSLPVDDFYNRKAFYAANRFWVFFTDSAATRYTSSLTGINGSWAAPVSIETNLAAEDLDVRYDPGGNYFYYHYQRGTPILSGYTRKGTPKSDGTITWIAAAFVPPNPWYVVLDQGEPGTGINKDDTVFYGRKVYIDASPDYWDYLVTLNNVTTGTQDPSPPVAGRLRYHGTGASFPGDHYVLVSVNGSNQEAFVFCASDDEANITYRHFTGGAWGGITLLDDLGTLTNRAITAVSDGVNAYFLFGDALSIPFFYHWNGTDWSVGEQPIGSVAVTDLALTVDLGTHVVYMVYSSDNMQTVKVVSRASEDDWDTVFNWNPTEHQGYEMAAWSEITTPEYVGYYSSGANVTKNISVYFGWFATTQYDLDFINMQTYEYYVYPSYDTGPWWMTHIPFLMGIAGFFFLIVSIPVGIVNAKNGDWQAGWMWIVLLFMLGIGLIIGWLWS